jgi:hypothetical protein
MEIGLIISFGLVLLIVILIFRLVFSRYVKTLEGVAAKLGCTVIRRKIFPAEIEMVYNGTNVVLFPAGVKVLRYNPIKTTLSISHGLANTPISDMGVKAIKLGNQEFDREFIVKGSDDTTAKNLLDFEMQQRLLALKDELGTILIKPDMVVLLKPNTIPDKDMIELSCFIAKKVI